MFDLPAGQIGWAAGYGYWAQTYTYNPDSAKVTSAATGSVGAGTAGSLYNNSVFGELLVPVFDNGAQSIDLKAGVRYDDWNAFDGEATWQLGLEFRVNDSLKLRATGGTVFRAPTISNLYSGLVDSSPQYSDPCVPGVGQPLPPGCAQVGLQVDTQVQAKEGGNPDLIPEVGDTFTAGLVWQPEFGESDLSLTVDYWQVAIEDGISSLGVQYTLDQCYRNLDQEACAKITRGPLYDVTLILDGDINVSEQGASGIDTEIRWSRDSSFGQWQASLLWSHLLERTRISQPGVPEDDLAGRYTDPTAQDGGGYAADKFNYSLQWFNKGMSLGYFGEFIGALDADSTCNCGAGNQPDGSYTQAVDSMLYHDLVASYEFESTGTNIAIGATNLTNEEPPWIDIGFNADTDPTIYRVLGRGYYIRLTQTFE
ncbi:MAG: TonB-dependent receptor, partial [Woeseiaceae bacterium]